MRSILTLEFDDGARIIKRLTNHWRHKLNIEQRDDVSIVHFDDTAYCELWATDTQLLAQLTVENTEQLAELQDVVLRHLNRIANMEFVAVWGEVDN